MNLFRNRHKKFEEKLSEQLDGLEYKPTESLWDKISSTLPEDGFEKSVADTVNTYKLKPKPETWEEIEAQLPLSSTRNDYRRFYWIPLLLMFSAATAYLGYELSLRNTPELSENNVTVPVTETQKLPEQIQEPAKSEPLSSQVVVPSDKYHTETDHKIISSEAGTTQKASKNTERVKEPSIIASSAPFTPGQTQQVSSRKVETNHITRTQNHSPDRKTQADVKDASGTAPPMNNAIPVSATSQKPEPQQQLPPAVSNVNKQVTANTSNINKTPEPGESKPAIANVPAAQQNPVVSDSSVTWIKATNDSPAVASSQVNKGSDHEDLTKFSISILATGHYCFNQLSAPANSSINFNDNIALRKKLESPSIDWSGAFLLDYLINNKWRISTGIMMSNFNQEFEYAVTTPAANHDEVETHGTPVSNSGDSIVTGKTYTNRIKYSWTEIPLFVTYSIPAKGKVGFDFTGGVSYAIVGGVDASYVTYNNIGVFVLKDKNSFPGVKNNFYAHFYPTLTYQLNPLVSLGLSPSVKYSITSITGNENWVQQHPYFIGLSFSLRKRF